MLAPETEDVLLTVKENIIIENLSFQLPTFEFPLSEGSCCLDQG